MADMYFQLYKSKYVAGQNGTLVAEIIMAPLQRAEMALERKKNLTLFTWGQFRLCFI